MFCSKRARRVSLAMGLLLARSIKPLLRGKSTFHGCSDFRSHLSALMIDSRGMQRNFSRRAKCALTQDVISKIFFMCSALASSECLKLYRIFVRIMKSQRPASDEMLSLSSFLLGNGSSNPNCEKNMVNYSLPVNWLDKLSRPTCLSSVSDGWRPRTDTG